MFNYSPLSSSGRSQAAALCPVLSRCSGIHSLPPFRGFDMRTALPEHHWSSRTVSELRTPCSSGLLCCGWSEPTGSVPPSREHGRGLPGWPRPPGQRWSRLSLAVGHAGVGKQGQKLGRRGGLSLTILIL